MLKVTLSFNNTWLNDSARAYPVMAKANVEVENVDVVDLSSSYIRSGRPDVTSTYSDLFVGYDDNYYGGQGSNIKIARTFIYFAMPNIGKNQRIENAVLKLYKEQDLDRAEELNDINIYNSNYVNPENVTWNNQPSSSAKQFISNTKFSKPKGFKSFDITKHVQELNVGKKKTLILQVTDESDKWRCNVFNSESTGNLPKVEIYHCDDFDIDPNLDINQFDNELRVYAKDGQYFEAISMDGISKPNSDINFNLYAKVNNTDFEKVKTQKAKEKSSPYFIDPIYVTTPLDGTQKYKKGEVNYTTNYLRIGEIPKYDTFYEYRMKVVNNGITSKKELITDGFIIYKVKLGDSLKSIASHYGLKIEDIKKDNNTSTNKIKEGDVLFLRFAKDNLKVPKDVYRPPVKLSSFEAKYVYRGPACFGSCSVADPINTSIGNFYHESDDFTLTDFDELSLKRVYNSYGDDNASIFGTNFSSNFEQYIAYDKDDNILFFRGDGKILKIEKKDGKYSPRLVDKIKLTMDGDKVSIYDRRTELTYKFDEYGTLTSIVTKTGFESKINYDKFGWIESVTLGNKTATFEYNDYHLVNKINLPNNTSVSYEYNDDRQLVKFTDAAGKVEKYTYDDHGKIKNITDKNGHVLANNTYDENGTVLSQIDANGNKVEFSYEGNITSVTYAGKETETYTLDNDYKVTKIRRADGSSKSYVYNDAGRMVSETDEKGRQTKYGYDGNGNLLKQTNPDGTTLTYTYDANDNITSKTTPDGKKETYKFDSNNNLIYKDTDDVLGTTYEYNSKNLVTKETNALGVWKKYEYEGHLIKKITHSNGLVENFTYDSMGNVLTESDSNGRKTTYVYDNLNRIIKKTDSYGKSESFKYDGNGNIIEYIDKLGGKTVSTYDNNNNLIGTSKGKLHTSKTYDNHNRVLSETDEQGLTVKYAYDVKGNKTKETDAYDNVTKFEYDKYGNVLKTYINDTLVESNIYDKFGRVIEKDTIKEVVSTEYDSFDQVIKTTNETTGFITTNEYDNYGKVTKTYDNGDKTIVNEYDDFGQLIKTTDEYGRTSTSEYDQYGRVVKEISATNEVTVNEYDKYGNVIKVTNHLGSVVTSTYDLLNRKLTDSTDGKKTLTYTYDAKGQILFTHDSVTDKVDKNKYDALGQVIETTDKLGNVTQTKYDALGQVVKTTDALGHSTETEYDIYGNVIKTTDALGNTKQSKYNALGQLIKEVDERGFATTYKYNDKFQNIEVIDKLGKSAKFIYNKEGYVEKATNQNGYTTTYEYDLYGQTVKETDPNGNVTTTEYDILGNIIKTVEPKKTTINTYDNLGRLTTTKVDDKIKVSNEYNNLNQLVKKENALGYETSYEYDIYGNITKETFEGRTTENVYNLNNQLIKVTENKEKVTDYTYDELGRELKQTQNGKDRLVQKYDAVSNVTEKTEKGITVRYKFDALNRVIEHIYPNADGDGYKTIISIKYDEAGNPVEYKDVYDNVLKRSYDANNNVISETNTNNHTTRYEYDSLNNMIKVQNPMECVVKYEYDGNNNMTKRIFNDKEATYEYDEANNLIKEVSEYGLKETYSYDNEGNMTSLTKNDGNTIKYTYDALGRKLSEGTREFEYDSYDNLTKATYKGKVTEYTYNDFDNITSVNDTNNNLVEYQWDIYGNRTQLKYKNNTVTYTYNAFGKIDTVQKNGVDYAKYSYDIRGNTTSVVRNDITTQYTYDELNRRTGYTNSKDDKVISTYTYEYDGENNILSETINGVKNTYTYNESDELKTSSKTVNDKVINTEYKYDLFANKVEASSDGTSKVYRYNDKNQLTSIKSQDGLTDIYYNRNGNISQIMDAGGYKESYDYDEFDQITRLKTNRDRFWNYEYDAEGDRIYEEKIIENRFALDYEFESSKWFDYIETLPFEEVKGLLEEKDSSESFDSMRYQLKHRQQTGLCVSNLTKYPNKKEECEKITYTLDKTVENPVILSDGKNLNIYGEERIATESEEERLIYISGLNESVFAIVNRDTTKEEIKDIMSTVSYDDAGNTVDITRGFGYNGEKLDESGNIYLRARYYNPRINQFVQIDSYRGEQGNSATQQRYTYCANNQYKYVDPSGHFAITGGLILGGIFGFLGTVGTIGTIYSTAKKFDKIREERLKNTFGKDILKKIENGVKNHDLDNIIPVQTAYNKFKKTLPLPENRIDLKTQYEITKSISKSGNVKIKGIEIEPCPYKDMTLVSQYRIIYDKVFNSAKENPKSLAQNAIKIKYFYGEAKTMLNFAITSLYDARGAGISESKSKLNVIIAQIGNYAKASYYLGKEFKKEVTNLSNIMYKNIISNTGPYRETSYWTSDYGDVKCHLHKDSEAYKFFSSKVYKDSIAFGKVTNVVMPLVSNVMTGYLTYKKYYTSIPNKYNNYFNPPKEIMFDDSQIGKKFGKHKIDYPEFKNYKEYKNYAKYIYKNHDSVIVDVKRQEFYYIKGKDLLRVKPNGEFVSLYPGANSPRVIESIKAKGVLPNGH